MIAPARVLALLLSLHAPVSRGRLESLSVAIASVASNDREACSLIAIEYEETSLRPARYEFGVMDAAARLEGQSLQVWAATALSIWRAGDRRGHDEEIAGFFWYNAGRLPQRVRGHSRTFRRIGRRALAYARRCTAVTGRLRGRFQR